MPNGSSPARRGPASSSSGSSNRSTSASASVPQKEGKSVEYKLSCTSGPAQGSDFPLKGEQALVGRAADIAVSIPDTSVSRRHIELNRAPDGWRAKDLGSG